MDKNIRNFLKYISLERRYSEHTIKSYSNDLLQFQTFLIDYFSTEPIFWHLVDKNTIRYFMIYLQDQDICRRSIGRKLATLKSFFKFLVREEIVQQNPAISIKMPKFEKRLPEYISLEEAEALLKLPEIRTFEGLRDLAILELFYGTGLRLAELINLTLSNILFAEDLIRVLGKGNKERILPLGKIAKRVLTEYFEIRAKYADKNVENIFVLKSGKKMYPMAIQRIVKKYLSSISNVRKKSPHILRHSYATHLLNAGASIRVVKDLLGHQSLSTTQVYTHMSIDHLKNIYQQTHPGASNKSKPKLRR